MIGSRFLGPVSILAGGLALACPAALAGWVPEGTAIAGGIALTTVGVPVSLIGWQEPLGSVLARIRAACRRAVAPGHCGPSRQVRIRIRYARA